MHERGERGGGQEGKVEGGEDEEGEKRVGKREASTSVPQTLDFVFSINSIPQ